MERVIDSHPDILLITMYRFHVQCPGFDCRNIIGPFSRAILFTDLMSVDTLKFTAELVNLKYAE